MIQSHCRLFLLPTQSGWTKKYEKIFVKDLGIVLEAGKELRFPLPLSAVMHQMYLMAASAGLGREDDSAVAKIFEQLAEIEMRGQEGD